MRRGYTSVTVTYEEIKHPARKQGKCPVCHRPVTRSRTFTNTASPFNVDPDTKLPRTVAQIEDHLAELASAWEPDFMHIACQPGAQA